MAAYKDLRWKTLTILAVVLMFSAVGVYPIVAQRFGLPAPSWLMAKQLQLGLDLKGGVHLVMRVNRDDALRISTEGVGEQLREALKTAGVSVGAISVTSPTTFRVEGVPQDREAEFRRIAEEQTATNYERSSGVGGAYDFTMRPNIARGLREQTMIQAHDTIDRRVNELGVTEPNIATHGDDGDQLLVQLPGISDVARAKDIIQSTALLELKLVEGGPADTRERCTTTASPPIWKSYGAAAPPDGHTLTSCARRRQRSDLRSASVARRNSQPAAFSLRRAPASSASDGLNIGRSPAIVLDDRAVVPADRRGSERRAISGGFTQQEAGDLALKLRSGGARVDDLFEEACRSDAGADSSVRVTAAIAGLALVVVFMIASLQALRRHRGSNLIILPDDGHSATMLPARGHPHHGRRH
jgi:preprotein translocase subunit SecD